MDKVERWICAHFAATLAAIVAAALVLSALPAKGAVADALEAVCRVEADRAWGTGTAFAEDQAAVYVLTAGHVAKAGAQVKCTFWRDGFEAEKVAGTVAANGMLAARDGAIIVCPRDGFKKIKIKTIAPSPRRVQIKAGGTIITIGCAQGAWPTIVVGHVVGYVPGEIRDGRLILENGRTPYMLFEPAPLEGRSGSAVFDATASRIVAVISGRTHDNRYGVATPTQALAGYVEARAPQEIVFCQYSRPLVPVDRSQCGPGGCGSGGCGPQGQGPNLRKRLGGGQNQGGPNQWQQLAPSLAPDSPPVDLGPILERQERTNQNVEAIAGLLAPKAPPPKPEEPATNGVPIGVAAALGLLAALLIGFKAGM